MLFVRQTLCCRMRGRWRSIFLALYFYHLSCENVVAAAAVVRSYGVVGSNGVGLHDDGRRSSVDASGRRRGRLTASTVSPAVFRDEVFLKKAFSLSFYVPRLSSFLSEIWTLATNFILWKRRIVFFSLSLSLQDCVPPSFFCTLLFVSKSKKRGKYPLKVLSSIYFRKCTTNLT